MHISSVATHASFAALPKTAPPKLDNDGDYDNGAKAPQPAPASASGGGRRVDLTA